MKNESDNYRKVFGKDDESLAIFLRGMKRFDAYFCELMANELDFNMKMEIHGNKGKMIHCRITNDSFERPIHINAKSPFDKSRKISKSSMGRNI